MGLLRLVLETGMPPRPLGCPLGVPKMFQILPSYVPIMVVPSRADRDIVITLSGKNEFSA
jgi:hypothetical protein